MNLKNSGDSTGFEPMTSAMPVQCSNQLSYEVESRSICWAQRFLISFFCSSTSNIDICVPRDWLQTTHNMITTMKKMGSISSDRAVAAPIRTTLIALRERHLQQDRNVRWRRGGARNSLDIVLI